MTAAKGMQNKQHSTAAAAPLTLSHREKEGKSEQSIHFRERGNKHWSSVSKEYSI